MDLTEPVGLLGRGSSRRKADIYTQDSTNTEETHADIHASSGSECSGGGRYFMP
jgi:hypothetical protein